MTQIPTKYCSVTLHTRPLS